jgi:hypothetical protein
MTSTHYAAGNLGYPDAPLGGVSIVQTSSERGKFRANRNGSITSEAR